jgi:hypothetical protein
VTTSSSTPIPDPSSATRSPDIAAGAGGKRSLGERLREVVSFLWGERVWLWFVIPYLIAWYVPAQWCWYQWTNTSQPLAFEPWIPLGAGLLAWSRRAQYAQQWRKIQTNYPAKHKKRRSDFIVLTLGCLLLLVGNLIQVKGIWVIALLLILVGVLLFVYGPAMTRVAALPLVFLCLMIPPPDSPVDGAAMRSMQVSLNIGGWILNKLHHPNTVTPRAVTMAIQMEGYAVEYTYFVSGLNILVFVALLSLWYTLYRRLPVVYGLYLLLAGSVLGTVINIGRIIAVALLQPSSPSLSLFLMRFPAMVIAAFCFVIPLLLMRRLFKANYKVPVAAQRAATGAASGAGGVIVFLINPLVKLLTSLGNVGRIFTISERNLEKGLSKLFKKKKKRNRW